MVDVDWSKRACADIHKHQDESVEGEDGCICSLEVVFFFFLLLFFSFWNSKP